MADIFFFVSGKGGTGKSTIAAACAVQFARAGRRVLLADCCAGLGCADSLIRPAREYLLDLGDAAMKDCNTRDTVVPAAGQKDLYLLPAPRFEHDALYRGGAMADALSQLNADFDVILLDGPSGLGRGVRCLAGLSTSPILVATPDSTCLRGAEAALRLLRETGENEPWLLLNRTRKMPVLRGEAPTPQAAAAKLGLKLLGAVPESKRLARTLLTGQGIADCGDPNFTRPVKDIVSRLLNCHKEV